MPKLDCINQVAEFHTTFKHPILGLPTIPTQDRCDLRVSLLSEELTELSEGIANKDIVEVADALCDLQYVLIGAVLEFGLGDRFKQLFDEVHRSNMSKACPDQLDTIATVNHYLELGQIAGFEKQSNGTYIVYRTSDNKTLKSVSYSPADLAPLLK